MGEQTIKQTLLTTSSKLGERIAVKEAVFAGWSNTTNVGLYVHTGRVGAIIVLRTPPTAVAKHIVAMNPQSVEECMQQEVFAGTGLVGEMCDVVEFKRIEVGV